MDFNTQKKLAKIFVLTDLLITELDEGLTEQGKEIQNKAKDLLNTLEQVNEQFYNGQGGKTTLFIELQNKFNYNFDKVYKK